MASEYVTVFNPSDTPVVVDGEGRTVGGHEWGPARRLAPEVRNASESGALIVRELPADAPNFTPSASAAAQEAAQLNTRHEALSNVAKETLVAAALDHIDEIGAVAPSIAEGLGSDHAHKVDVLDALVRSSVDTESIAPAPEVDRVLPAEPSPADDVEKSDEAKSSRKTRKEA